MKKLIYAALAFSPIMVLADAASGAASIDTTASSLANTFSKVVSILIPAFFGLAVIYFFYGVAKYVLAAGDPKKASEGKSIMIYGVIAIAVMASLYGIIGFLQNSLGVTGTATINTITLPKAQ